MSKNINHSSHTKYIWLCLIVKLNELTSYINFSYLFFSIHQYCITWKHQIIKFYKIKYFTCESSYPKELCEKWKAKRARRFSRATGGLNLTWKTGRKLESMIFCEMWLPKSSQSIALIRSDQYSLANHRIPGDHSNKYILLYMVD